MIAEDEDSVVLGPASTKLLADESDSFAKTISSSKDLIGLSSSLQRKLSRKLEKFHRGDGAASTKIDDHEINGYNLFDVVLPPYNLDYLATLPGLSAAHHSAICAKVANIVGLGYDFVESSIMQDKLDSIESEEKTAKVRKKIRREKIRLKDWLDSCHEEDSFTETCIKVYTDYETTGNGYFEIGRKITGEIGYIGHIPSTTVRVRKNRDGFVQIIANKAVFFKNFGDTNTLNPLGNDDAPNEIIHIKKYTPKSNFYGGPDIIAALQAIAGNEFANRFNLDYFENKAVPRYAIIAKGASFSSDAKKNILSFFETGLKGQNHRTIFIPLPADNADRKIDFNMVPIEAGVQDSSFNNYRKANINDVLMAHRVPINKVSVAESASLAVARDADKTFKEQVCRPQQKILEKKINKIIKELTDAFEFKFNELTLTDEDTQSKIDERYLRMQVLVPNEIRSRWGLPGIKNGDRPVQLTSRQAAESTAQATGNRARDQQRTANSTDSSSSTNTRATQGDGRQTP